MTAHSDGHNPTLQAIRNAVKLGGSLLFTWGIALAMRLLLPRSLGPSLFGTLNYADAFTTTFFVILNLGAETYVRKEVAVRPEHASDFIGGSYVLRVAMTVGIYAAMAAVLHATHRPPEVQNLVYLFAFAQFFVTSNATLSALLHAKGKVDGSSVLAVLTKVVWAVGVLWALAVHARLWAYAASYLASEAVETVFLYRLAQRHLGLRFRIDVAATKAMILSSMPYYLGTFAATAYGKLDVTLLDYFGTSREVGWYGAASAVAGLTLLVTPLIGWVLTPMFARAAARSTEEFFRQVRRSLELIMTVAIPASLLLNLGADLWIRVIFGAAFAPAAPALRILATMFVLTYVAIIYASTLIMLERPWTLTLISVAGLVVNPVLNLLLIRRSLVWFGDGGGGVGCALAMLGTEIFVSSCLITVVGRGAFDRRTVGTIGKSLVACAVAVTVDRLLVPLGPGRIVVDALAYLFVAVTTGALRVKEMASVLEEALRRRKAAE